MISLDEFQEATQKHIGNIGLSAILTQINIRTDEQGNILSHIEENLRKFFRVAARMAPDQTAKDGCQKMLDILGD